MLAEESVAGIGVVVAFLRGPESERKRMKI